MTGNRPTTGMVTSRSAAVVALLVGFGIVVTMVAAGWSPLRSLDIGLDQHLNHWFARHRTATSAARTVSAVGQPATFEGLAVVAAVVLWLTDHRRLALFTVVTVPTASVLSTVVKALVARHRPTVDVVLAHAGGSSFPSGHAMSSVVGVGVLVTLTYALRAPYRRTVIAVAVVIAMLVGFSRLALGVHYLSDVIGGWLLGLAWLLMLSAAFGVEREPVNPAQPL